MIQFETEVQLGWGLFVHPEEELNDAQLRKLRQGIAGRLLKEEVEL